MPAFQAGGCGFDSRWGYCDHLDVIWDCVIYNGETEMLDIRMAELADLDVQHVLVEGRQTFQGNPKPVEPVVRDGVIHHVVDLSIENCLCGCVDAIRWTPSEAWVREAHQRNAVLDVINGAQPFDLILLGDADEIPAAPIIRELSISPIRFLMDAYFFDYRWFGGRHIPGTVAVLWMHMTTPALLRHAEMATVDGGWHLTYMGGVEAIERKVSSFSHSELADVGKWAEAIETGVVPWTGTNLVKSDPSKLPQYVQDRYF